MRIKSDDMSELDMLDFLSSQLSVWEKAKRRIPGKNYKHVVAEEKYRTIRRFPPGSTVEIRGAYVKDGTIYGFPGYEKAYIIPTTMKETGIFNLKGTIRVRREKVGRRYEFQKYLDVSDYEQDHTGLYSFHPPLKIKEIKSLLGEYINTNEIILQAILNSLISAPVVYRTLGGVSDILDSPEGLSSPIPKSKLEAVGKKLEKLIPSYHREVGDFGFSFSCVSQLPEDLRNILRTRRTVKRELSLLYARGSPRREVDELEASLIENVLTLDKGIFTVDEEAGRELFQNSELVGLSIMAHHSMLPSVDEKDIPKEFDSTFDRWIEELREDYPQFVRFGGLCDPSFYRRRGHVLRLSCARARERNLDRLTPDVVEEALYMQRKFIDDFAVLREAEIKEYAKEVRPRSLGREGRMIQDFILDILSSQKEAKREFITSSLSKEGFSSHKVEKILFGLEEVGRVYQPKPETYRLLPW